MPKWIYSFERGRADGHAGMVALLGNKGAQLAEMCRMDLPVPPGFTITSKAGELFERGDAKPLTAAIDKALAALEKKTGRVFGSDKDPLLLSVRAGARVSMPGMMDTILNIGLNDIFVEEIAARGEEEARFIWDCYRRLIQTYAEAAMGMSGGDFAEILDIYKHDHALTDDSELTSAGWRAITDLYKARLAENGHSLPQSPAEQLWGALAAVFASWNNTRAAAYRRLHAIDSAGGTAATVQMMVFGNRGGASASGVAFTRDPASGEVGLYGEFLLRAQGEDVVAGSRTPLWLTRKARLRASAEDLSLEECLPRAYKQLHSAAVRLEAHYRDMQDIEFTVEEGVLWILQTRAGKRTGGAALKIATALAQSRRISREEALLRVDPASLEHLLRPVLDSRAAAKGRVLTRGLGASPGAASGEAVFSAAEAEAAAGRGRQVILIRPETHTDDIQGMHAAAGILTRRGGMTSHAAVVARGMGRPCITAASSIRIEQHANTMRITQKGSEDKMIPRGTIITIDGTTGCVYEGVLAKSLPRMSQDFTRLMEWADAARRMEIRVNASTAEAVRIGLALGAEGVGLIRTEHIFSGAGMLSAIRRMILADTDYARAEALAAILPLQRAALAEIFGVLAPRPVTVRLLDAPLHEFLPREEEVESESAALGVTPEFLRQRVEELHEINPMLGHRGCRLAVSHPEIYDMQVRAILQAAAQVRKRKGRIIAPDIMVPLTSMREEMIFVKARVEAIAAELAAEGLDLPRWRLGTMIELPRAALCADALAREAEFFSFGTNDLTQTVFGISRDDASHFLRAYTRGGLFSASPFAALDREGVGALMRIAAKKGREVRPAIILGLSGEHAGDAQSAALCEEIGLDYISCAPWRVPLARLAAAQAAVQLSGGKKKRPRSGKS